jgi:ectoine hydroxylase-related dioxygenase (phytanoyl-CoA dioxygenase family)
MISLSTIVAVDAFTADNGGTEVVPGSHRWGDNEVGALASRLHADAPTGQAWLEALSRPVELAAGDCVVFAGTLVHRGGANRMQHPRLAFSNQYCQPWARQQENFTLAVPVEVARAMPPALQALLGYSIHPPFMGQLTASHPAKALDSEYENRVVAQARAVGARLPE